MRARVLVMAVFTVLGLSFGQQGRFQINVSTPEGQLLQQAMLEGDETKKLALFEDFLAKYARHEGAAYAMSQAQPLWLKAKKYEKVTEAAGVLLAADAEDSVAAYNALQASEQKADVAGVVEWAAKTIGAARKKIASAKPGDAEAAAVWEREVDYARQVITRCEYSYYATALKLQDAKGIAALGDELLKANPDSQYVAMSAPRYLMALGQLRETAKGLAFCDGEIAKNRAGAEVLLFAADVSLTGMKDYDKAAKYAQALVALSPAPAPAALARGHWILGTAYGAKENWVECDKAFKAGLAAIEASDMAKDLLPGAYFYLGLSNYNLGRAGTKRDPARLADAKKYFTQCAALASPFQAAAQKNLSAMAGKK